MIIIATIICIRIIILCIMIVMTYGVARGGHNERASRERARDNTQQSKAQHIASRMHIYIYIYVYIEREI